jgi:hypothetical protein
LLRCILRLLWLLRLSKVFVIVHNLP